MTQPSQSSDTLDVRISPVGLDGILGLPLPAEGIVLFAHGGGSGRFSPRNNYVAAALRRSGLATLLFDLLTEDEAADRRNAFDIELLADRLGMATTWARQEEDTKSLPIGYFGASTGAAAALVAAARAPKDIGAIVSRGGRSDMAGPLLGHATVSKRQRAQAQLAFFYRADLTPVSGMAACVIDAKSSTMTGCGSK